MHVWSGPSAELLGCERGFSVKTEFSRCCAFIFDLHLTPQGFGDLAVAAAWVVTVDAGVDARQGAHAALVVWVETGRTELEFIVAGYLDEGTPPEGPFETGPKSGGLEKMIFSLKCITSSSQNIIINIIVILNNNFIMS